MKTFDLAGVKNSCAGNNYKKVKELLWHLVASLAYCNVTNPYQSAFNNLYQYISPLTSSNSKLLIFHSNFINKLKSSCLSLKG